MKALVFIALILIIITLFTHFAGIETSRLLGIPAFALIAFFILVINWLAFVPSYLTRTEKYYDFVGMVSYLMAIALAWTALEPVGTREILLGLCVVVWSLRLGLFLFKRIRNEGADSRFDKIKHNPLRFLTAWTLQSFWVIVTASTAIVAIVNLQSKPISWLGIIGFSLWGIGFGIEILADSQKNKFRKARANNAFIHTGLWAYSRHPNYFGEILLWAGIALIALPDLSDWQLLSLFSPLFVFLLLTRISGVNLLEKKDKVRFKDNESYQRYRAATNSLIINPWRRYDAL